MSIHNIACEVGVISVKIIAAIVCFYSSGKQGTEGSFYQGGSKRRRGEEVGQLMERFSPPPPTPSNPSPN